MQTCGIWVFLFSVHHQDGWLNRFINQNRDEGSEGVFPHCVPNFQDSINIKQLFRYNFYKGPESPYYFVINFLMIVALYVVILITLPAVLTVCPVK